MNNPEPIGATAPIKHLMPARILLSLALGGLGLVINLYPVNLFADLDFNFGNTLYVIAAFFLGPWYAMLAAIFCLLAFLPGSDQMLPLFVYPLEAIFLGVCQRKGRHLYWCDIGFWVLIGAPLAAGHYLLAGTDPALLRVGVMRDLINGVFCTAVAIFIVPFLNSHLLHSLMVPRRPGASIRVQLMYATSVIVSIAVLSIAIWFTVNQARTFEAQISRNLDQVSSQFQGLVEDYLEQNQKLVKTVARTLSLLNPTLAEETGISSLLAETHPQYPSFISLLVADIDGRVIAASPVALLEKAKNEGFELTVADRDYFQASALVGEDFVSPVFRGRGFGSDPIVAVSSPIYTDDGLGGQNGIVEGSLDLGKFASLAFRVIPSIAMPIVLLDEHQRVIFASSSLGVDVLAEFQPQMSRLHEQNMLQLNVAGQEESYYYRSVLLHNNWRIYALSSRVPVFIEFEHQFMLVFAAVLFSLVLIVIASGPLTARLSEPLGLIMNTMNSHLRLRDSPLRPTAFSTPLEVSRLYENLSQIQDDLLERQEVLEDIVAQRTSELQESEERWKFALEGSGDGVWDWDLETDHLYFSEQWKKQLGFKAEDDFSFESVLNLVHKDDSETMANTLFNHLEGKTKAYQNEHRMLDADGKWRWILGRGMVTHRNSNGRPLRFVGTDTDISSRKEAEKLQHRENKMSALGTLTGGIAHDYNNMLNVVRGYAELLVREVHSGADVVEYAREIVRATERGESLTKKLLSFSRQQPSETELLELDLVIDNNINMLQTLMTTRINIDWFPAAEGARIQLNREEFEDALINLCINAMHAIDGMGTLALATELVDLEPAAAVRHEVKPGAYLRLTLTDSGCGMDEDTLSRIFDPYFSTKEMGTGLGLSQVYGLVQSTSGSINVTSQAGIGSRFELLFPVKGFSRSDEIKDDPESQTNEQRQQRARVLVVDDELALTRLVERMMTAEGYEVTVLNDPVEAASHVLTDKKYSLLVTDVLMPGMDGYELATQVVHAIPDIKVLFVSGYGGSSRELEKIEFNYELLPKPYTIEIFLAAVNRVLGQET